MERRNWMDNPKPEFLWVFAADKTLRLHKHSPSCPNRFANLILKHFLSPLWCRYLEGGNKCLQPSHLMAFCRIFSTEENSGTIVTWGLFAFSEHYTYVNITQLTGISNASPHMLMFTLVKVTLRSNLLNCSLLKSDSSTIRTKFRFSPASYSCCSSVQLRRRNG